MYPYISLFKPNTGKYRSDMNRIGALFYAIVVHQFYQYKIIDVLAFREKLSW